MFKKSMSNAEKTEIKKKIREELDIDIRDYCRGTILDMFRDLEKVLKDGASAAACESFDAKYEEKAKAFIEGEAFIDAIVARIMAKQLINLLG